MRTLLVRLCTTVAVLVATSGSIEAQTDCPRGSLPAYAHNDYENSRPLVDAVTLGYRGVEADIFLVDDVLRVGHDEGSARDGGTLELLYLRPLQELLTRCGPLVSTRAPFFLALELKEQSAAAYDSLLALLGRYDTLLRATKPNHSLPPQLTIVLVGWHPASLTANVAVDTMLAWQQRISRAPTTPLNERVRLLSIDYGKTMGRWWVTSGGRKRWLAAIRAAKDAAPDRLVRAHNVPLDRRVYRELFAAGVDLIGTKELRRSVDLLSEHP